MAVFMSGTEDELEFSNQQDEDKEYVCIAGHESTEREEGEEEQVMEEYVCLCSHERSKLEEEEMDEEQQVMREGSCGYVCL